MRTPDAWYAIPVFATQSVLLPYPVRNCAVDVVAAKPRVSVRENYLPCRLCSPWG